MSRVIYLRLVAFLPLVVPFLSGLLLWGGIDLPKIPTGVLIASLLVGGVPYALTAATALLFLRHRPARTYWAVAFLAPLFFVPVFGVFLLIFLWFDDSPPPDARAFFISSGFFALYILPLGYFYVLISWLGYYWCDRHGLFRDAA